MPRTAHHAPCLSLTLCDSPTRRLVGKVSVVVDKRRVDGSRVRLAEVEVGDETGIVSLRARDEQIDTLEEVSGRAGAVVIRNCTLELYQGRHMRLAVTKWGKLSRYPDQIASTPPPPSKINRDRNFSLIDLSKVASEMVVPYPAASPGDPYQQQQQQHHHQHPHHQHHHSGGHHQEAENHANRAQQPYSNAGRRGRRPPSSSSSSSLLAGSGRSKPPSLGGHYGHDPASAGMQGPATAGPYPAAGLHGYGGLEASPYLYPPRQADSLLPSQHQQHHQQQRQQQQQQQQQQQLQQQQHMMMHQQYEIQPHHRPMHQAAPPPPPPPLPPPAHMVGGGYPQDRMGGPPPAMMNPDLVAQTTSGFDLNPFGMAANPFLSPIPPPHSDGAMPTLASSSGDGGGGGGSVIRADSPHGKMNPQAATFDPVAFRK
jgi:hypothetical protein